MKHAAAGNDVVGRLIKKSDYDLEPSSDIITAEVDWVFPYELEDQIHDT